ncbi:MULTISPECIES: hypothetical protein [unclassified Cupriavidus]|uniref:hypothetical protein n=1 Tax=unclassified Cupriavidus TaxID=2640874 RepID=UPI001BFFFC71|nr:MULTISPECIES: hypothetical protein [unclassified Cupriavidus]MCA3186887.1 hypothetical protein [Cupriavidus sp.]MCA3194101.1 hypothetical protein [Cupriavidus sp.]MCA3199258.1 hypothetical protein [Cupriavidus sp.]MCA3209678.1 hypothetical protein [Cupriavidus sp.]QWE97126.1 hypothetical protein KLP38_18420 [Cupriavidus sp. EM10]
MAYVNIPLEDRMRACACLFWFESYLGAPEFPASDGLIPLDPMLRQRYIDHQDRCRSRWLQHARSLGGNVKAFEATCIAVRASWFGPCDILMRIRGLASAISEPQQTEHPAGPPLQPGHDSINIDTTRDSPPATPVTPLA